MVSSQRLSLGRAWHTCLPVIDLQPFEESGGCHLLWMATLRHFDQQANQVLIRIGPVRPRITGLGGLPATKMIKKVEFRQHLPNFIPSLSALEERAE